MSNVKDIRKRIASFPAIPPLCQSMLTRLNDPDADFKALADATRYDPGMTANILKLANSAYIGAPRKVESLQAAFVRLGVKKLFQLVVASGMAKTFSAGLPGYRLQAAELLKHSVWVAVASEELAAQLSPGISEMLFTAGLLHDIGKVIVDPFVGQQADELVSNGHRKQESFDVAEKRVLGISHAEAGAELLDGWKFPAELVATVRWHHAPLKAESHARLVGIVHIADMLAYTGGIGAGIDGFRYSIADKAVSDLCLTTKILEQVASRTLELMNELDHILMGRE